jgi:sugar phosphate permease
VLPSSVPSSQLGWVRGRMGKQIATAGGLAGQASQRWIVLALLIAGTFFCYVHRSALSIAAPSISKHLGSNPATMGILLSVFFWSYALAQMPMGWLADRYGVGRTYAAGFLMWAFAWSANSRLTKWLFIYLSRTY